MTDKTREAFERYCKKFLDMWSNFECWQAATAEAEAKYLPVIEKLVEALIMSEAIEVVYWGVDGEKNKQAQIRGFKRKRKKALALAKLLLEKKEEV